MDTSQESLNFCPPQKMPDVFIQVAPMIDIMFMLICFYMLVGQMVSGEKDPGVQLPKMTNPAVQAEKPAEIVLNLLADGRLMLNGQAVPIESIGAVLAGQKAKSSPGRPLNVVIRADRRQRFERLDQLLRICKQAGLTQVVFRSEQGEDR